MAKIEMSEEELQAFVKLSTYLTGVVLQDPVVEPDVAKEVVEKAKVLKDCMSFPEEIREKFSEIAEIFTKLSVG